MGQTESFSSFDLDEEVAGRIVKSISLNKVSEILEYFVITDVIGYGSYGAVLKVKYENKMFALKIFPKNDGKDISSIEKPHKHIRNKQLFEVLKNIDDIRTDENVLLKEYISVKLMNKEISQLGNIINYYRFFMGRLNNKVYYCVLMDFVDGLPLDAITEPVPIVEFIELFKSIRTMHKNGFAHGDIVPAHIIRQPDPNYTNKYRLVLIDYKHACTKYNSDSCDYTEIVISDNKGLQRVFKSIHFIDQKYFRLKYF